MTKRVDWVLGVALVALGVAGVLGVVPAAIGLAVRRLRPSTRVLLAFAALFGALAFAELAGALSTVFGRADGVAHLVLGAGTVIAARRPRRRVARMG